MMTLLKNKQRTITRKDAELKYGKLPYKAQYIFIDRFGFELYYVKDDVLYKFNTDVRRWNKTDMYPMYVTTLPETRVIV